jgi:hypothetical protein
MTTLVPKYDQGSTGAVNRPFNQKLQEFVSVKDFGAVGDTARPAGGIAANTGQGTDDTTAFENALLAAAGKGIYVPAGGYTISRPLTITSWTGIILEPGAHLHYFDTTSPGTYLLNYGIANGTLADACYAENLYIYLHSGTSSGIYIGNGISNVFNNTYMEGWVPPNPYTGINSRTNVGVKIQADGGSTWYNQFNGLNINHVHHGVNAYIGLNGGSTTQQIFNSVQMFGDHQYGDTEAIGFLISGCTHSNVNDAWLENYSAAAGRGAIVFTDNGDRWRFQNCTFDDNAVAGGMNAIVILGTTYPGLQNTFIGNFFNTTSYIVDPYDTLQPPNATNLFGAYANYVEDKGAFPVDVFTPDQGLFFRKASFTGYFGTTTSRLIKDYDEGTFTATLLAGATSLTLTNATCYYTKVGRLVTIQGNILVGAIAAPGTYTGSAVYLGNLPFAEPASSFAAVSIMADGLDAGATTAIQAMTNGGANRNMTLYRFSAGTAQTLGAFLKTGMTISFNCTYIAAIS